MTPIGGDPAGDVTGSRRTGDRLLESGKAETSTKSRQLDRVFGSELVTSG